MKGKKLEKTNVREYDSTIEKYMNSNAEAVESAAADKAAAEKAANEKKAIAMADAKLTLAAAVFAGHVAEDLEDLAQNLA